MNVSGYLLFNILLLSIALFGCRDVAEKSEKNPDYLKGEWLMISKGIEFNASIDADEIVLLLKEDGSEFTYDYSVKDNILYMNGTGIDPEKYDLFIERYGNDSLILVDDCKSSYLKRME